MTRTTARTTAAAAALAALPLLLLGGAAPAHADSTCSATFAVAPRYSGGVVVDAYISVTVKNLRTVNATGWTYTAEYPDTFTTDLYWSSVLLSPDLAGTVSFGNVAWNGTLRPGGSAATGHRVAAPAGSWPAPLSVSCTTTA